MLVETQIKLTGLIIIFCIVFQDEARSCCSQIWLRMPIFSPKKCILRTNISEIRSVLFRYNNLIRSDPIKNSVEKVAKCAVGLTSV